MPYSGAPVEGDVPSRSEASRCWGGAIDDDGLRCGEAAIAPDVPVPGVGAKREAAPHLARAATFSAVDEPIDPRGNPQALKQLKEAQWAIAVLTAGNDNAALDAAVENAMEGGVELFEILRGMRQLAYQGFSRAARCSGRTVDEEVQEEARRLAVVIEGLTEDLRRRGLDEDPPDPAI
jgi:hypothetical protein